MYSTLVYFDASSLCFPLPCAEITENNSNNKNSGKKHYSNGHKKTSNNRKNKKSNHDTKKFERRSLSIINRQKKLFALQSGSFIIHLPTTLPLLLFSSAYSTKSTDISLTNENFSAEQNKLH